MAKAPGNPEFVLEERTQVYDSAAPQRIIITQLKGIYERRSLLRLLIERDLTVRYKRSIIGVWWSLLNPLITTAVFFYVFNTVFKQKMSHGTLFLPYLLSGILCMTFFSQSMTMAADSIAQNSSILTKVYVRPEVFALSSTIANAINFLFGLVPLTIVLVALGKAPGATAPLVLIFMLCMVLFTTGLGLLLAIAYINFDDVRSVLVILLMLFQYMTPVFYPLSALGPHTQSVIKLNPLTSFLEVFRTIYGNNASATFNNWAMMIATSLITFLFSFYLFQKKWAKLVAKL